MGQAATPYAEALLLSNELAVETDLIKIFEVLKAIAGLEDYLISPLIDLTVKKNIVKNIFEDQISLFSLNFLFVLLDRRRINIFPAIIKKYLKLRYDKLNKVTFEITSVIPLSSEQNFNLIKELKSLFNADDIELTTKIEPSILGGLLIQNESQFIDLTVKGDLRNFLNSFAFDNNLKF